MEWRAHLLAAAVPGVLNSTRMAKGLRGNEGAPKFQLPEPSHRQTVRNYTGEYYIDSRLIRLTAVSSFGMRDPPELD